MIRINLKLKEKHLLSLKLIRMEDSLKIISKRIKGYFQQILTKIVST